MEQQELDLRELFWVLRRRLWLILLVPLVSGLVAGVVSLFVLKPVYSASTTIWVKDGSSQINYNELLLNRNLTKTYAEVARSRAVMAEVISTLRLNNMTVQGLQSKLSVTPVRDTEILSFTIEDGNPEMAARLADAVVDAFMGQVRSRMKIENVEVVDRALVPVSPIKPRPFLNVAIAVVLGTMAGVGVAFLLEFLDTSIKRPEDITRHLGLPVLGAIPVIEAGAPEATVRRSKHRAHQVDTVVDK